MLNLDVLTVLVMSFLSQQHYTMTLVSLVPSFSRYFSQFPPFFPVYTVSPFPLNSRASSVPPLSPHHIVSLLPAFLKPHPFLSKLDSGSLRLKCPTLFYLPLPLLSPRLLFLHLFTVKE